MEILCSDRNSKRALPEYKSEDLPLEPSWDIQQDIYLLFFSHSTLRYLCNWYSCNTVQADVRIELFGPKDQFDITGQARVIGGTSFQRLFSCLTQFCKNQNCPLFMKPYSSLMSYLCRSLEADKPFPRRAPCTRKWNWNSSCDFERSSPVYIFSFSSPLIANFFALFITKGHPISRNSGKTETRSHTKVTLCQLTPKSHWVSANSSCYY